MHPNPCQNIHWYPLTSSKNIWPKISVAYFTKWYQPIFTVGGWRMYRPFNFRLLPLHTNPHRVVKGPHFEAWTRPEPEITSLNPARVRHLFLKPDLVLKANQGSYDMRNCRVTKTLFAGIVAGTRFITPKITTTLTKTLASSGTNVARWSAIILRSAEYDVSQEKKETITKLSTMTL